MELTYREENGILYPNLEEPTRYTLGKYGQMAKDYLKETQPGRHTELLLNGTLMEVFHQVDEQASQRLMELEDAMLAKDPPPKDFLASVQHRNHIRQAAEEIVLDEIVYRPR